MPRVWQNILPCNKPGLKEWTWTEGMNLRGRRWTINWIDLCSTYCCCSTYNGLIGLPIIVVISCLLLHACCFHTLVNVVYDQCYGVSSMAYSSTGMLWFMLVNSWTTLASSIHSFSKYHKAILSSIKCCSPWLWKYTVVLSPSCLTQKHELSIKDKTVS